MWRITRASWVRTLAVALSVCWCLPPLAVHGAKVTMRDGRVIEGSIHPIRSMSGDPNKIHDGRTPILVSTDDLRRYFLPTRRIDAPPVEGAGEVQERFRVWQPSSGGGSPIVSVGPIIKIDKFDRHGRRKLVMNSVKGPKDIIQGITEITPVYTKVTTLKEFKWDMRIATSSIPRQTLADILFNPFLFKADDKDHRLRVVRFYLQAERFEDAQAELDQLLEDAPEIRPQYQRTLRNIRQLSTRRLLNEVRVLERAGRTKLVWSILNNFPSEGVAGATLQEVQEMLAAQRSLHEQGRGVLARLDGHLGQITDEALRNQLAPIRQEMIDELTVHSLDRMATYQQVADDPQQTANEKVAFAVSGWLLGPEDGTGNLAVALSLFRVRNLIREYCNTTNQIERDHIISKISSQEGGTPSYVAKLIAHMSPPKTTEPQEGPVGHYKLTVEGVRGGAPVTYYVQLPPEYDPYRRYPAVVTLRGAGSTVKQQVDWWAGNIDENGNRKGQGARHGYIVIAPEWGQAASERVRVLAPRTRGGAEQPPRRLPPLRHRYRPRVSLGALDGRRRRLGPGARPPGPVGRRDPDRGPLRQVLRPVLEERRVRADLLGARRIGRHPLGQERDVAGPLHDGRLSDHGLRVSGSRPRALLRRSPQPVRLDEPQPPQLLSSRVRVHDDADVGQLLLVAGSRGPARKRHRRTARMAQKGRAGAEDSRQAAGQQQHLRHRGRQRSDAVAVARGRRFPLPRQDRGQRQDAQRPRPDPQPGPPRVAGGRPHAGGDRQHAFWVKITLPGGRR